MTHRGGNRSLSLPPSPLFPFRCVPDATPPASSPFPLHPFSASRASLHHVLPLYHTRGGGGGVRMWIWDCVMHMQLHLASGYARPITAVKLDCRRLSPADRPNKTRIFSGITAVTHHLPVRGMISILYFMGYDGNAGRYLCMPALFADNVGQGNISHTPPFFRLGKYVT